jgi:tetratricopeptide (TPR) repeat protein
LSTLGQLEEAEKAVETAIAFGSPAEKAQFYRGLASFKHFSPGDSSIAAMEALAQNATNIPDRARIELQFALGKAYSDAGDHPSAMQTLLAANREQRRRTHYNEAATLAEFDDFRTAFPPAAMAGGTSDSKAPDLPIFIVGMPRCGSSLVEQILASHPQVHGAGECEYFASTVWKSLCSDGAFSTEAAASLQPDTLYQLGEQYRQQLRARAPEALRITDKNLKNFLRLGAIHRTLPAAKVIHVRRDPVDTCLSCFSYLFDGDYPYAYDLAELGRYWRAYDGLMAYWRQALPPGVMLEIAYEDLVEDPDGQTRRLLAYCGLEWSESCLDFHRSRRPVRTASVSQVRRTIYRGSMHRWQAYGTPLQPLLDALKPKDC